MEGLSCLFQRLGSPHAPELCPHPSRLCLMLPSLSISPSFVLATPHGMGDLSSPIRDQTPPALERWSPAHWTTREVPLSPSHGFRAPQIQNDLSSVLPLTTSARTPFPRKAHSEFGEDMNLGGGGCSLSGKESACSAGDRARSLGGEDPLEKGTAPVFWPGESQGQRSLAGYSPRGHNESDTTERL